MRSSKKWNFKDFYQKNAYYTLVGKLKSTGNIVTVKVLFIAQDKDGCLCKISYVVRDKYTNKPLDGYMKGRVGITLTLPLEWNSFQEFEEYIITVLPEINNDFAYEYSINGDN